ncbi:MAG: hypothetical protein ACI9M6_000686, partial [Hydrogenophaga sp.]
MDIFMDIFLFALLCAASATQRVSDRAVPYAGQMWVVGTTTHIAATERLIIEARLEDEQMSAIAVA